MFYLPSNKKVNNRIVQFFTKPVIVGPPLARPTPNYGDIKAYFSKILSYELEEMTITLKPKFHNVPTKYMFRILKKYIENYFYSKEYFKPSYFFVPEATKRGVIHLHGIVTFQNCSHYHTSELKRLLNNKFGNTKGNIIKHFDKWFSYLMKDVYLTTYYIYPFYKLQTENSLKSRENNCDSIILRQQ